ncbi:hypothetical protein WJ60_27065 [Burkholderia ubonensis]|nr:hypothetical protein WJ60_27065 [Burkholderia ubonensis]
MLANAQSGQCKFLSRNEFRLLQLLMDGPQTKETLIERIWTDRNVIVTDASYYQLVTQLRNSFDELGLPKRLIRTIPRYGLELVVPREDEGLQDNTISAMAAAVVAASTEAGQSNESAPKASPLAAADMGAKSDSDPELDSTHDGEANAQVGAPVSARSVDVCEVVAHRTRTFLGAWAAFIRRSRRIAFGAAVTFGVAAMGWIVCTPAHNSALSMAQNTQGWIRRDVGGSHVYVKDPKLSLPTIASYVDRVRNHSSCVSPQGGGEYYLEQKPAAVELLAIGPDKSASATYCFY